MAEIDDISGSLDEMTPMMQQYLTAKRQHPGIIMFFRMGDFYELFFEDARVVASELNIALTTRGKNGGGDIPMCGVPVVSIDYHLAKLVKLGYKVAICEQLETPEEAKKRGYKAIVNRGVTRIVTPGTVTDEAFLSSKEESFLMSIVPFEKNSNIEFVSFAVVDVSTDKFVVNTVKPQDFLSVIEQYSPKEVLIPSKYEESEWFKSVKLYIDGHVTVLPDVKFNKMAEERRLLEYYQVATLESFGISVDSEISACGSIVEYVSVTKCTNTQQLSKPTKISQTKFMIIDAATHRNLEIVHGQNGKNNTLFQCLDETVTAFGGRCLGSRMVTPIIDKQAINDRLDSVEYFTKNDNLLTQLRQILRGCPDLQRIIVRMKFGKFSPRDIGSIKQGIYVLSQIINSIKDSEFRLENKFSHLDLPDFSELFDTLSKAVFDDLPVQYKEGAIIRDGYSSELDDLKNLVNNGKGLISDLQVKYASQNGISTLKIKNNNILGWYIEIPLSQKGKAPPEFIHKQTLVNNVRYVTEELVDLQEKLLSASSELVNLESKLINELVELITARSEDFDAAIDYLCRLDIALSMAYIAGMRGYTRPELTEEKVLKIEGGRHPVLELLVDDFISNDCDLCDSSRISILTGPNMAGKSTYLRQNALIILMAQIGSFVPANQALIGITDRLFSRIGASDDLAKGRSTFMVEMIETASILNQATDKSFVILDEVGRGTSTYDGISIAWAVVDHIYKINRCRTIFATHYMELTSIKNDIPEMKCQTLKVHESKGKVVFCHSIIDGIADKAYGVYVAKLAGLPKTVVSKANSLLNKLEKYRISNTKTVGEQLSIFSSNNYDEPEEIEETPDFSEVIDSIKSVDLNDMTPRAAMEFLYELKSKVSE